MKAIKVIPCGTPATSIVGNISGIVTAAIIRFDTVRYELSYYYDGEYKTTWLHEQELKCEQPSRQIGFKTI